MTTMFKTTPPDLFPMQRSKSDHPYFDSHIMENSKRQLRFVGFSVSQHATISALQAEQELSVKLEVKQIVCQGNLTINGASKPKLSAVL